MLKIMRALTFMSLLAAPSCTNAPPAPELKRSTFKNQVLIVTDYGDEGISAYIPSKEREEYEVVFDDQCDSCVTTVKELEQQRLDERKICRFSIAASGSIRPTKAGLSRVMDVDEVLMKPEPAGCFDIQ